MKKINLFTMIIALMVTCMGFGSSASAQLYGDNLVVNGDFADNSEGTFATDYLYVNPNQATPNTTLQPEGVYTIGANAGDYHNNFTGTAFSAPYFLIVNGHTQKTMNQQGIQGTRAIVWQQTVDIEEGVDYEFSFMLSSLVTASPAELRIVIDINGEEMVEVVAPGTTNNWVKHVWSSMDKSETATITIYDDNIVAGGNDFGIDDIVFKAVCPEFDDVVTVNVTDVTCNGDEDGIIELVLNGAKPFNACISAGCDTQYNEEDLTPLKTSTYTYSGLMVGEYTITVVDANGCVYTQCVTVGEPDVLEAELLSSTDITCFGLENGEAVIEINGGTTPYTASEGTVDGNILTLTGLAKGEHVIVIDDAHECGPVSVTVNIVEPTQLEAGYTATPILCHGGVSSITVTATEGTPPYRLFDGEEFAADLTEGTITLELPADTYNWNVRDANDCSVPVQIVIDPVEPISIEEISRTNILCFGDDTGTIEVSATGGTGALTYSLNGGEPQDNGLFTELYAGEYVITVTDANECIVDPLVINLTQPDAPLALVEAVITPINCAGDLGAVTLTVSGGTPPYYFILEDNEPVEFDGNTLTQSGVVGNTNYNWTVRDTNGCEFGDVLNIFEPTQLTTEEILVSPASCFGAADGMAWITVTGGTAPYTSDMGSFDGAMLTVENLAAGSQVVKIFDENQCMTEANFIIGEPAQLIVNVDDIEVPLCAPENAPGCEEPFIVNVVKYAVGTAQYGGGVVAANRQVVENVLGAPDYSNSGNNGITFTTLGFAGHMIVELGCDVIDGEGDDLMIVETSYGISDCDNYPEKAEIAVSMSASGPWTVLGINCLTGGADLADGGVSSARFVKITDKSNLEDFNNGDGFDLNGIEILNAAGSAPFSASATLSFSGVEDGMTPEFTVMEGDDVISISNSADLSGLMPGTYTVVLTVGDCSSAPAEFTVPVFPEPIDASAVVTDVTCNGLSDGKAEITITGGTAPYTLIDAMLPEQKDAHVRTLTDLAPGTHTYIIIDANDCMGEVTFTVGEPDALEASVETGMILCHGGTTTVDLTIAGGTAPYVLSDNNSDFVLNIAEAGVTSFDAIFAADEYSWTVTDVNDCLVLVEFEITQPDPIIVSVEDATIECFGGTTEVTVTATGGNEDGVFMFSLYKGDVLAYGPQDNGVFFVTEGTYNVFVEEYLEGIEAAVCSNMEISFTATQPDELSAVKVLETAASCFGAEDGEAVIDVTGGTPAYTFSMGEWIDGQLVITGLAAGTYDVEISDACQAVVTVPVTIGQPEELVITNVEVPTCTEPANYPTCEPYAMTYISHEFGTATYGEITDDRDNYENALGEPDTSNSGDDGITFVSLGNGGHIILGLGCDVLNGEGDDLQIVEDSWGYNTCGTYKERAEIAVSQYEDGPWSYLGEICLSGSVDLANGVDEEGAPFVLDYASFVKVTDVTLPTDNNNGDGYDLNGIINLNPAPVPPSYASQIFVEYEGVAQGMVPVFMVEGEGFSETFYSSYIPGLAPGNYTVTLTVGDCVSESFEFFIPEPLAVDFEVTPLTSINEWNGEISGMITGGVGPYNICLFTSCTPDVTKNGETTDKSQGFMYWGLQAGNYMIRVVDQMGCMVEICIEVPVATEEIVTPDKNETPLSSNLLSLENSRVAVYPNPFKTQATFEFSLTQNSDVTLEVYNMIGERVAVVFQGTVNAFENQKAVFNAESLPNGIYIYKLTAGDYIFNDRVVLTR